MSETNNSFSTVLADFVRMQNNALEIISKQSQAMTTDADAITVTTSNLDGTTNNYTIPSFSGIKGSIERINTTITTLMGLNGSEAYVRMPDGSFKRIYQAKIPVDPPKIGNVTVPAKFIAENNWFFESMLSPALKVNFDVTTYVPQQESKIGVKRLILALDTQEKNEYFDGTLQGKNDIDYVGLLVELQKRNIAYFVDEDIVDLPLSVVRYSGIFTVVSFGDFRVTLQDGTEVTKRRFLFDTLQYNDNLSTQSGSLTLAIGDQIIKGQTIYEVTEVNPQTRQVGVKRLQGYEALVAGEGVQIYSPIFSPKLASVGIGFDEKQVIFFKSIDDEANLISTQFSPGVAFFSNALQIELAEGTSTLAEFYRTRVLDFGSQMLSASKNGKVSVLDGLSPDAPALNPLNFKVVQINDHKLDQEAIVAIRKKSADKIRIESLITKLETAIDTKKEQLNTTNFASETERRGVKNELESLIREKNSQSSLYASIVKELAATAQDAPAALDAPKYRVRGFFDVPAPKFTEKTGFQNVIQFYIYYRYVNPAGNAGDVKQFDYKSEAGESRRATFSNLILVKTDIRDKTYDEAIGKYVWEPENIEDPEKVNINQIDIPISKGEKVEFYVVSISEAGWPESPLLSVPSNIITIEYPLDLTGEDEALIALNQATKEATLVQFESDLAARGLDIHLSSSFNAGEQYYAHSADALSSSFYDSSGVVISLYEKLKALDISIQEIQNNLASAKGELRVFLIDRDNNSKTEISNGSTVSLFAGFYQDFVNLLPAASQRGAIVNKIYTLSLENPIAATLELVSRFPGGLGEDLPVSLANTDVDYATSRRYDIVPTVNTSIANTDTNNATKISSAFYQSGQLKSQFLYLRHTDIGLAASLYVQPTVLANRILQPTVPAAGSSAFVWRGTFTGLVPNGNGTISDFCIHTLHPRLYTPLLPPTLLQLQQPKIIFGTITNGLPGAPESISAFRHSFNFNTLNTDVRQLEYQKNWTLNGPFPLVAPQSGYVPNMDELPDKYGFINDDRFLIGKNTCGSYLFLAPATFDQLLVDGTDFRAIRSLGTGESNAIQIPIIYQFRMTDFAGDNTGTGTGFVGGFDSTVGWSPPTQLNFAKKIGIDLYTKDNTVFSFDVQVSATYKRESIAQRVDEIQTSLVKTRENITYSKSSIKTLTS